MSSSSFGAGRGRGWLNLPKTSDIPRPGGLQQSPPLLNNTLMLEPPSQYKDLVDRIKELNEMDDGIKFNQKMKYIQQFWNENCQNKQDVEDSFDAIYNAGLAEKDVGSKLVTLIASRSFTSLNFHDCNIRQAFLIRIQKDFENSSQLQARNGAHFRHVVHMLGDFYRKAKLVNGEPFTFLAAPLISCLEHLIISKSATDLHALALELFKNGAALKTAESEAFSSLALKVRVAFLDSQAREARLWLLFVLDLVGHRFGVLPPELVRFYADGLGAEAVRAFQTPMHDALSIQTVQPTSRVLDGYQSDVSVLQISTSPTDSGSEGCHAPPSEAGSGASKYSAKEKAGRPILGAGARYRKDESNGWGGKRAPPPTLKNNKGWQHDDRFENDYN